MSLKVAIIGGLGFIGKNLTEYFCQRNFQVTVIDHSVKYTALKQGINYISLQTHHTSELVKAIGDSEYVIWLVHASVPSTKVDSLVDDFNLNVLPIIKFLEEFKKCSSVKKFIYMSSGGTIYGDNVNRLPINEMFTPKPISNYGHSKLIVEKYIEYLTKEVQFQTIILRPSNVYGEYQNLIKPQGIIGYAFKAIKNNELLELYNDGVVIRDFIYVMDLASATYKILLQDFTSEKLRIFNVSSGLGFSIKDVLNKIEMISNSKLKLNHKSSRDFDCEYNVLDNSKLSKELGWSIETQLEVGLVKVWNWILKESIN